MKIKIYNQQAEEVGEQELNPDVFALKINEGLVYQAAVAQMANQRQVLAHTKERNEVRGGGAKPWRQKGTGRARAGSSRSPIWIGGGITFGPRKNVNYKKNINAKMKQKAILMVLSDRAKSKNTAVLDEFELKEAKTKEANQIVNNIKKKIFNEDDKKNKRSVLILIDKKNDAAKRATANLERVKLLNINNINIVDLLKYRNLILTVEVVKKLEEKYRKNDR